MKYRFENCRVINVVDGDTIDVLIDVGFYLTTQRRFRLNRINCPETRTKDKEEKKKGLEAKMFVKQLLQGQKVILETEKAGKYGRFLAEIHFKGDNINDMLVKKKFAKYQQY